MSAEDRAETLKGYLCQTFHVLTFLSSALSASTPLLALEP